MSKLRVAVVGAGQFGRNHIRVFHELEDAELVAVVDADAGRADGAATDFSCRALTKVGDLRGMVDAAVIAAPTSVHAELGVELLEAGIDVMVEKPIAPDLASAQRLIDAAERHGRILQVGHLERFNPVVQTLEKRVKLPLFFEIHRMSVFTPRSLDVDVVLDLMIHDIDILLALTGKMPEEIRAAGLQILSGKVDIANVRLQFPGGCVANLTASRVSTEKVRKLRVFQPHAYLTVDYSKQELFGFQVGDNRQIRFQPFPIAKQEPLRLELQAFLECVRTRTQPKVDGRAGTRALEVALAIIDKIELHNEVVANSLHNAGYPAI